VQHFPRPMTATIGRFALSAGSFEGSQTLCARKSGATPDMALHRDALLTAA
jgi:hypothetical protein